ncbi:MAG: hypothetical protein IJZ75_00635 [Clostridia bacterium]|nr:hypothetical protein [Clostridia bacterium]
MKTIFKGEVYDVVPMANGFVFAYAKAKTEDKVAVFYKMVSFEGGVVTDVAKNIYLLSKFGSNYHQAAEFTDNHITAHALTLQNGKVFISSTEGEAYLLDDEGKLLWSGELKYKGKAPSGIAIHKNSLWACFKESNVILRINIATMREELRIGGKVSPLNAPTGIFIDGDTAIITSTGNSKLVKIDLNSYAVSDYKEFEEPITKFVKVKNFELGIADSGLYLL